MTRTDDPIRAAVRLRPLDPSGLNPPQTEVIDHLEILTEDGLIDDLDVDIWGPSMGLTQLDERDPAATRETETVMEFKQWADKHGYTLQPAFEWRSAESGEDEETQVVTPLITLAVYSGEDLQAVYPHVDDEDVWTVHDGVEALASRATNTEQEEDEQSENLAAPLP